MAEEKEQIEFGVFEVRASDEGGAEVRLSDTRNHSNLLLRRKSVGKDLERGAKYLVTATLVSTQEEEMVTVEMPADETAGLTRHAKVVDDGGTKTATKKGK